jgi:tRNA(Ile)-lysidine synthase
MSFKQHVADTIKKHSMVQKGDKVIVALSGGSDSVALLYVLKELESELGIEVFAANLNHKIRGKEGDDDSLFVKELCEKLHVTLFSREADIPYLSKKYSIGEEECGRRERYALFEDASRRIGGAKTATGHHLRDDAETVLFHLFRGSAGRGLSGIPYVRGNIIRPLLDSSKEEIEKYLTEKGATWRTDSTNFDNDYTRNRIRNIILPKIEEFFPNVAEKISAAAEALSVDEEYFVSEAKKSGAFENGRIDEKKFAPLHESVKRRLAVLAMESWGVGDIDTKKIEAVCDIALGRAGRSYDLGSGVTVIKDYGFVRLKQKSRGSFCLDVKAGENAVVRTFGGHIELKSVDKYEKMSDNKRMVVFDAEKVGDIQLRSRREGDIISPVGMNGKKKLKEIFIDLKIPRETRDEIIVAAKGNEVLFIPGIRASRLFKPSDETTRFLIIKYMEGEST